MTHIWVAAKTQGYEEESEESEEKDEDEDEDVSDDKRALCRNWQKGECRFGDRCWFKHVQYVCIR